MNPRKIISSISLYTALGFLPALSRVLLLPLFLVYMPIEEFGLISLNNLLTGILPVFMTMGLEHSLVRFYFDYRSNQALVNSYLSTILLLVLGISLMLSLAFIPFGEFVFDLTFKTNRFTFSHFGLYVLLQSGFMSIISILTSYFRTAQLLKLFAIFSIFQLAVSTAAEAVAILYFNGDALLVVTVKTWATGIVTGTFLLIILFKTGITFEKRFLPSSFKYALPIIPYILFGIIFTSVDRIIIENYLSLISLAVFNLAVSVGNLTELYIGAIQNATYPMIYDLFKKGYKVNSKAINAIYKFKGSLILLGAGGLTFMAYPLIHYFLIESYQPAIALIPILLAGYMLRFYYIAYSEPIFFFKATRRLPALNFTLGAVSVAANFILIPALGLLGATLSALLARGAQLIPTFALYKKISDFRFTLGKYNYYSLVCMLVLLTSGLLDHYLELPPWAVMCLFSAPLLVSLFAILNFQKSLAPEN